MENITDKIAVVKLIGGLGNQLFQYHFGRFVQLRDGTDLFFDLSYFEHAKQTHERERLSELQMPFQDWAFLPLRCRSLYTNRFLKRMPFRRQLAYFREQGNFIFQPGLGRTSPKAYYEGFWQVHQYLERERVQIAQRMVSALKAHRPAGFEDIADAVCVHVRRGDYMKAKTQGFVGLDYYRSAIALIAATLPYPRYVLVSDDISWAQTNLNFGDAEVLVPGYRTTPSDLGDMSVMSSCRHHVIANSTFSWWAAWLASTGSKDAGMIIAPRVWFPSIESDLSGLYPSNWIRI